MKRWIWIPVVIVVIGAFVSWRAFSADIESRPDVPVTPEMIERGRYLAVAADCIACHTAPGGEPFAGGLEFDLGEMGKLYSSNITPDEETGIGTWSDDDFRRAMHLGIGKGGKRLYPAFPYASYSMLTDEDVLAIKAYLFSLEPVKNTPPPNEMKWPYNQRWLMAYWNWLFNPAEQFVPDESQSPEWNRGKYLVEGLGHCGECHTPRNFLQGPKRSQAFGGAVTRGWHAYNISSDPEHGIGSWTDEQLVSYFTRGYAEGRGPASGPMAEVISHSLRHLTEEDIRAMIVYLRSTKPIDSGIPAPRVAEAAQPADAGDENEHGRQMFAALCSNCHKADGSARQIPYEALRGERALADPHGTNLTQVVLYGTEVHTPYGRISMPGFGDGYTDSDLAAVINYAAAKLGGQKLNITPEEVAKRRTRPPARL